MAMTWYDVKSKTADGYLNLSSAINRVRSSRTQRINARWREAWVADAHGKILDEITFKPK